MKTKINLTVLTTHFVFLNSALRLLKYHKRVKEKKTITFLIKLIYNKKIKKYCIETTLKNLNYTN